MAAEVLDIMMLEEDQFSLLQPILGRTLQGTYEMTYLASVGVDDTIFRQQRAEAVVGESWIRPLQEPGVGLRNCGRITDTV